MLNKSQAVRFAMASGMYLLLMWGYLVLPSAQWYAAFLALVMSTMLVFWVTESASDPDRRGMSDRVEALADVPQAPPQWDFRAGQSTVSVQALAGPVAHVDTHAPSALAYDPEALPASLEASIVRLDSLKKELMLQYAQFGRDQSLLNSNGLGSWHGNRTPGEH